MYPLVDALELGPGRELDVEVAARMGQAVEWWWGQYSNHDINLNGYVWRSFFRRDDSLPEWALRDGPERAYRYMELEPCIEKKPLPCHSTDITAAMRLIEQITKHGGMYGNDIFIEWWNDDEWYVCNQNLYSRHDTRWPTEHIAGRAPKLSHAIARFFIGWAEKQKEYWGEYPTIEPEGNSDDKITVP